MKIKLLVGRKGVCYWNILWDGRFRLNSPDHPCYLSKSKTVFKFDGEPPIDDSPLSQFRERGYWASCFPEGDGISFAPNDESVTREQVAKDIKECFGFEVLPEK